MNFDELALKVAQQKFPICVDTTFETVFVEYAKALREEWVKSLEPVAWRYKPREGWWSWNLVEWMPVDEVNYVTEPLYTLEELSK